MSEKKSLIFFLGSKTTPQPQSTVHPSIDCDITYFLKQINEKQKFSFLIDRNSSECKTPRRNPEIEKALGSFQEFRSWAEKVRSYFESTLFPIHPPLAHNRDLSKLNTAGLFVPIIPLFERGIPKKDEVSSKSVVGIVPTIGGHLISVNDLNRFLDEQKRSIDEKFTEFTKMYPDDNAIVTFSSTKIALVAKHAITVADAHEDGINYIENMMYDQLEAAIGKIVTATDFQNYMKYHNKILFKREFEPRPFCYAIRRPNFYPEGIVSIDAQLNNQVGIPEPILTHVSRRPATRPMKFPINAATNVEFTGDRYLHATVLHDFSGNSGINLTFEARARQFSIYLVMVGRIAAHDLFEPTLAFVVQNKDDVKIPLSLETIPTPKEFKDAIESLSPEQQRFAKQFRAMQLASTLFAVLVIQVKPQMEKLLKLPQFSLTKEIKLTQQLQDLFLQYQIPSDLLSFDGDENSSKEVKINRVKENVGKILSMIEGEKQKEIEKKKEEERMRRLKEEEEARQRMEREREKERERDKERVRERVEYKKEKVYEEEVNYKSKSKSAAPSKLFSQAKGKTASAPKRDEEYSKSKARSDDFVDAKVKAKPSAPGAAPTTTAAPAGASAPSNASTPAPTPNLVDMIVPSTTPQDAQQPAEPKPEEKPQENVAENSSQQPQEEAKDPDMEDSEDEDEEVIPESEDFTKVPTILDKKYEDLSDGCNLRPTIINVESDWEKSSQKSLLSQPTTSVLGKTQQVSEKNKAFDLLDALSRSGSLSVDAAELHVIIAATHCFVKDVVDTVIQDNVNPIEKVEKSNLIVATTVHDRPALEILKEEHVIRVATYSPQLFDGENVPKAPLALEAPKTTKDILAGTITTEKVKA